MQCLASIIFLYFACITPIVTFGGLLGQQTGGEIVCQEMVHFILLFSEHMKSMVLSYFIHKDVCVLFVQIIHTHLKKLMLLYIFLSVGCDNGYIRG